MKQLISGCHSLTARKIRGRGIICALLLYIFLVQVAYAEEKYPTKSSGEVFVEIGISPDNTITMTHEKVLLDVSEQELGDELYTNVTADYTLSNASDADTSCLLSVVKIMKVKKIEVPSEEVKRYHSGVTIKINNRIRNGYIYPLATKEKLTKASAYSDETEALSHINYLSYFNEAYKKYDSLGMNSYSPTADYYIPAEDGEEMVCVVLYELFFEPLESVEVSIENSIKGSLKRPFSETRYGSTFSFTCVGDNLNSFYNVEDVDIEFKISNDEELGFIKSSGPVYTMDSVYKQRYRGGYKDFTYKIGHELTEDEINDVWSSYGFGRKFIDALQVVGTALFAVSVMYLLFSIKKRRQSGIGKDINNYFSC